LLVFGFVYAFLNLSVLHYIFQTFLLNPDLELLIGLTIAVTFTVLSFFTLNKKKTVIYYSLAAFFLVGMSYLLLNVIATYPSTLFNTLSLYIPNPPIESILEAGNFLLTSIGFVSFILFAFSLSYIITKDKRTSILITLPVAYGVLSFEGILLSLFMLLVYKITILFVSFNFIFFFFYMMLKRKDISYYMQRVSFEWREKIHKIKLSFILPFAAIIPIFMLAFYEVLAYPPIEWDSLAYGVSYSGSIFINHGIRLLYGPEIGIEISGNYPPGTQTAVAFLYTLAGGVYDLYYRLFIYFAGVFTAIITYSMAIKLTHNSQASTLSILALAMSPLFIFYTIEVDYSMYTALEFTAVFYLSFLFFKNGKLGVVLLDALCASFAGLTSYIGLFAVFFVFITILLKYKGSKTSVKLIIVVLLFLIPEYIFLIRNFILLGNPIYPFFGIGKGLNSLIYISTKNEIRFNVTSSLSTLPSWIIFVAYEFARIGTLILLGLISFIGYLIYIKKKSLDDKLLTVFIITSFLIAVGLMFENGAYFRYVVPFISILALTLAVAFIRLPSKAKKTVVILTIVLFLLTIPTYLPYVENVKSIRDTNINSTFGYLDKIYGYDAETWQWIDNNTPSKAVIGTYEIRTYYINRTIFSLDNPDLLTLYTENLSPIQVYSLLEKYNISYIFSVSWASKVSPIAPETYYESSLTKNLGDPHYFRTVYANPMDSVYQVVNETSIPVCAVNSYSTVYLNTENKFVISTLNSTTPWAWFAYLPIQPDYINDTINISLNDSLNASVELWNSIIPNTLKTGWWGIYTNLYRAPKLPVLGEHNPSLSFKLSNGYFTLIIVDWSNIPIQNASLSITIDYNR
jgi:hypothetical protein